VEQSSGAGDDALVAAGGASAGRVQLAAGGLPAGGGVGGAAVANWSRPARAGATAADGSPWWGPPGWPEAGVRVERVEAVAQLLVVHLGKAER
jgi:hypothetical protein